MKTLLSYILAAAFIVIKAILTVKNKYLKVN